MASYTTNLNLKKPAGSEAVAIGDINNNMDTIDQAYGTLNGKINNLIAIQKLPFSNLTVGSDGNITFSLGGHQVIAIAHDMNYYMCTPWKDGYNYWHGKLTSASNDSHPSSGTISGTVYYVD